MEIAFIPNLDMIIRWQKRMEILDKLDKLDKLKKIFPQIQAVVHFASSQEQITDQNTSLNKWLWQLLYAIDDADDVVDELEYMELEREVTKNKKLRMVRSIMKSMKKRLVKIGKRALKIDPTLKRLEEAVQKLDKVSADVTTFLHLIDSAKQEYKEQEVDFYEARETVSFPTTNDLIGRGKDKKSVVQWLRKPSNEHQGTDLYRNISLLCIVGHGGMGKTTLLQHVYNDEITQEFDLKMWVCVSNNFDVKKVIADMLQYLNMERPRFETLWELQGGLKEDVMSKKFLLVLDDLWEEDEENRNISKWEDVLAPLASGGFGSKILITTRMDAVALMFARLMIKKVEIVKLEGLDEDECLQLLNSHAFAGVENPHNYENLRVIARDIVKKLLRSPLAAKVIGGVLNSLGLDERLWREVLESNLLDWNSINSILRLSYIVLPNHLQNCFAFCCMFPQDHEFDKDDLIRMWIALGFIQQSQEMIEDIGRRYLDVLVKKSLIEKVGDDYKMRDLIHESASKLVAQVCIKLVDDEESSLKIPETLRHLSVRTTNSNILKKFEKFKHLRSLFLFYEDSNEDICSALAQIFKALRSLRLLYIFAPYLKMIPEEIGNLIHLRYLKIYSQRLTMLPRSLSNLYHLQNIIHDSLGFPGQHEVDFLPGDINKLSNLRYLSIGPSVPMLRELPNLPPSLKYLSIWRCHPELKERYREDGGSDRHKIAHIPNISI